MAFRDSVPQSAWMDDVTSRTRSTTRRMASAKAGGTTKRTSPSRGSSKGQQSDVSPARWAGVALVMAAIVGAIVMAMISPSGAGESSQPSQPGSVAEVPAPSPTAAVTAVDVPIPVAQPVITSPTDGTSTPEIEIAVTVDIPDDTTVRRRDLELHVYNGSEVTTVERPAPGTTVTVEGVRLAPGANTIAAVLGSLAGPGPASDPVVVILDETQTKVEIISPQNKTETYDDVIPVQFTSEVGATVRVVNEANTFDDQAVVGPSGEHSLSVRLKRGKNRIVATSVDEAGQRQEATVNVVRLDGRPKAKLKYPRSVKPPGKVRIVVDVTDSKGAPMPDAEVHFSLGGTGRVTVTEQGVTNDRGRAVWNTTVATSTSPAATAELGVIVYSPSGEKAPLDGTINLQ
jgi:hypothetical protein